MRSCIDQSCDQSPWRRSCPKVFKTGPHIAREREPRSDQTRYQTRNCTILRACPTRVFQAKNQRKEIPRTIDMHILVLEWEKRCGCCVAFDPWPVDSF
jgi:hypothetical protein